MPLISRTDVKPNDVIKADKYNQDHNTVYQLVNGSLDRDNIHTRYTAFAISPTLVVFRDATLSVSMSKTVPTLWPFMSLAGIGFGVARESEAEPQTIIAKVQCKTGEIIKWEESLLLVAGANSARAVLSAAAHAIDPMTDTLVFLVSPQSTGPLTQGSVYGIDLYLLGTLVSSMEV